MRSTVWLALALCALGSAPTCRAEKMASAFSSPPASARPWVYWFWLNGNTTREGITADLEAMKRVGIGGALIMEVDQGAPQGPIGFMSPSWMDLFHHASAEAKRLGLEINMNNDAGWNGSGGPWIKPEQSMQKVVWTDTDVQGPRHYAAALPQPETIAGYYRDTAVLAFPKPGPYRIPGILVKAAFQVGSVSPSASEDVAREMVIDRAQIVDVTAKMDASGRFVWDVPPGEWTVARFGHTSTGAVNAPAPLSGRGLECDKLSAEGAEANFNAMMALLAARERPRAGGALVATHVDSWENGSQNWTGAMREEFTKRRGYDPLPFLPVITGRVVGSSETSERFLWDLRRTISELVVEKYAGTIRDLAHANGLRFTTEAYGGPCDDIPYGGQADEPMGEFWMGGGSMETCRGMASAAHVYGKPIVGAESFTAGSEERWLQHPASIKALGDRAFCEGINRFVFHRYAMQPWVDNRRPGMTMGPWGLHYERTQTWWEQSRGWHTYLARCQYMLRQGRYAADICYLQAEAPPQGFNGHKLRGYAWDECSAEVVLDRMSVRNGRIALPGGMTYRVLALPSTTTMTPALLRKIAALVKAGATVTAPGPRPMRSPSLSAFPGCDDEVARLGAELWGDGAAQSAMARRAGKGRVLWGSTPEQALANAGVGPDFAGGALLNWIHRTDGDTEIYFVANPSPNRWASVCTFRVTGKTPELWWPDTGRMERAPVFRAANGTTRVYLSLGPSGSVFVLFRAKSNKIAPVVAVRRNGAALISLTDVAEPKIVVQKAVYGVPGDEIRTRDVRVRLQRIIDAGERTFQVARMADGDDPAYGIVKTLRAEYTVGGKRAALSGTDPETVSLEAPAPHYPPVELTGAGGGVRLTVWKAGRYALSQSSGKDRVVTVSRVPPPLTVAGPWAVRFPSGAGAPARIARKRLASLSEDADEGVRHFSGTATWTASFPAPPSLFGKGRRAMLDLGDVQVIAEAALNGKRLGILWKPPYCVDVTSALRPGRNELVVKVTNLWPNRLIGDEGLPEDSDRNPDGTLKDWPNWLLDVQPSPTGRLTFTTWRLWRAADPLPKSGLIGPVTIRPGQTVDLK